MGCQSRQSYKPESGTLQLEELPNRALSPRFLAVMEPTGKGSTIPRSRPARPAAMEGGQWADPGGSGAMVRGSQSNAVRRRI